MTARSLWLLRHAKSSWDDPYLDDHDRPLAPRGRKAAPRVGAWLRQQGVAFDLILCSTATRAQQTLKLVDPPLAQRGKVKVTADVYGAPVEALLDVVRKLPDDARAVLVVGHNPGLGDLAPFLAGDGPAAVLDRLTEFPTAAVAGLSVPGDWDTLGPGTATAVAYAAPRDLVARL